MKERTLLPHDYCNMFLSARSKICVSFYLCSLYFLYRPAFRYYLILRCVERSVSVSVCNGDCHSLSNGGSFVGHEPYTTHIRGKTSCLIEICNNSLGYRFLQLLTLAVRISSIRWNTITSKRTITERTTHQWSSECPRTTSSQLLCRGLLA